MNCNPPDPILEILHGALRKPVSRPLHDPLLSWTTISVDATASASPPQRTDIALSLSCWLVPPSTTSPRLALVLRFHPAAGYSMRTIHPRLQAMIQHTLERDPAAIRRCRSALHGLFPSIPPSIGWHVSRPVPIDGRAVMPPAACMHAAATCIPESCDASLRLELDRHLRSTPLSPRPAVLAEPDGHPQAAAIRKSASQLLRPPSRLADWLLGAFPRSRYRALSAPGSGTPPSALDSLCPIIELHSSASHDRESAAP